MLCAAGGRARVISAMPEQPGHQGAGVPDRAVDRNHATSDTCSVLHHRGPETR